MKDNYLTLEIKNLQEKYKNGILNFTNNMFMSNDNKKTLPVYCPLNGEVLSEVTDSDEKDLEEIVFAIEQKQKIWEGYTFKKRADIVYKYRNILIDNIDELSMSIHLENGKCLADAKAEVLKSIETVEFACSMPNIIAGRLEEVSTNVWAMDEARPLGIVSSITPFNFPAMVPHWTIAQAIVLGNSMILKPSEQTPITSQLIAKYWKQAGLPDGVFNLVNGGTKIVQAICDNPKIKAVSFVGSTKVAEIVYKRASGNLKRALTLGGAKNFITVLPDSPVNSTVRDLISSAYGMVGQRCMAASVIIAVDDFKIKDKLVEELNNMSVRPNADFTEGLSPVSSLAGVENIKKYIDFAKDSGAKILVNGLDFKPEKEFENGYYLGPTLIDWRGCEDKMSPDEIFGPVLEIVGASNLEEAIKIQNNSPYGNAASIFTGKGLEAFEAIKHFKAGMLGINIGVPVPREPMSFGGIKLSKFGFGDITGPSANQFWTDLVKVTMKWNPESKKDWLS
ncbi:methylmalonate-semialdehyde dehydrogenase [Spiroplasma chinense]|uniref:Methylmalonate-semialdehyde dehydrogenase n=1 Tax=Spiroplasma chinense TaxID=216932 RepID=A0A5B9Y6F7_9MOLU|nr:aldehyde dehydrogenase family protein [Spiroplasma chinense]QEH61847.1 methylmalonate-semialdehyde dehydrogenase [Spiroplasma chinense]